MNEDNKVDELQKPVGSVSVLASEEEKNRWRRVADELPPFSRSSFVGGDGKCSSPIELTWDEPDAPVVRKAEYFEDPHYGARFHAMHDPFFGCEWWPKDAENAPTLWRSAVRAEKHVPASLGIDDDFDDEPLPARTCAIDGEECESCQ